MRGGLLAVLATAATVLAVATATNAYRSSDHAAAGEVTESTARSTVSPPGAATPPDHSSPSPHPLNTPPATPTPEPLEPPPVGPYQPNEPPELPPDWQQQIEEFDVVAEIGAENLSTGTKRLVRDLEAGAVTPARATRIALAKMGYLDHRVVPERYQGAVTQFDYYALTFVAEQAGLDLSDAEAEQVAAEVDAYTYGASTP